MPVHGLFRPIYIEPPTRSKRYILSLPDVIESNDIEATETNDNDNEDKRSVDEDEVRDNFEKRHIGSLARLGLLPSFRFSGSRYSRSGRARLLLPSQELYRKHSADENFGIREYFYSPEADATADSNDADLPLPPILANTHPTGRYLHRSLNDLPASSSSLSQNPSNSVETFTKNNWQPNSKDALSLPVDTLSQWPTYPRRNIAALARDGYLKSASPGFKRSISTLAKNGQLPTFRSPNGEADKTEEDDDEVHDKRNIASIARLRSYSAKRNIQALARDGYRVGRGHYNQPNDKRNIASMARNGMIHKRDEIMGDEYYYPFFQNPLPPLSEIDGPFDMNEMYDFKQSMNPDMLPPLSQVFKRSVVQPVAYPENDYETNYDRNWYLKRGTVDKDKVHDNFEKRHIGSLARLGLLPSFRFSGSRYSRSGRARLLLPSQELNRKHSADENFGIREYFYSPEADATADSNDADLPPPPILANTHPTGRYLHRSLNDLPASSSSLSQNPSNSVETFTKNNWQPNSKNVPRFYYFRSLKVPFHSSGKRYLLLPAVDNIMLRKNYRNSSLPSRRKNQ
ncbi:unnamed protein product [Parnassius apollo]|uniref:(apollo) hypothetical protein n=1 Tax=Parnassius apollo TaxID=110799 RepID=A0A8S3WEF8_PARAO|nr:unnamed protein product [Parnassius apollo]